MTGKGPSRFPLFLTCPPGLEPILLDEVKALGWSAATAEPGGVALSGAWHDVWRANLLVRGASRVLVRLAQFTAKTPAALFGKCRDVPWGEVLGQNQAFRVEAVCKGSAIYHSGAAEERVAKAAEKATGAEPSEDGMKIMVRIVRDVVTISADTSGPLLHKRGFKEDVAGAPLRETMGALFLRACGHKPGEVVLDPFCGSGTIPIEAAEINRGLAPGRGRSFAFEKYPSFLPEVYQRLREKALGSGEAHDVISYGYDRVSGAVAASTGNAERAGLADWTHFETGEISRLTPPEGAKGLILTNPPYGARLGDSQSLVPLYKAFGQTMRERFGGWRIGLVTAHDQLAKATGLKLHPSAPVPHGGLKVRLWQSEPAAQDLAKASG